jgi:hypothetical protein
VFLGLDCRFRQEFAILRGRKQLKNAVFSLQKRTEYGIASPPARSAIGRRGIISAIPARWHSNAMKLADFYRRQRLHC